MTSTSVSCNPRVEGKSRSSPLISDENFRDLYSALLRCTILDMRLQADSHYERWIGRESATAGVVACLGTGDTVTLTPRGRLAACLRTTVGATSALEHAKRWGNSAEQLADGAADALRRKLEKRGNVTAIFAAAPEPDRIAEILGMAVKDALPLFLIVNTSIRLPGIPVIRVDGSDAVAVYRVAHESIKRAREGGGPTIMECAKWSYETEAQDPLGKLELYLTCKNIFRPSWKSPRKSETHSIGDVLRSSELHSDQRSSA